MCPSLSQNVAHWCNDSIFDNSRFHLRFSLSSPKKFFPFTFVVSSLVLRLIFDCRTKKQRRENEGRTKDERWSIEEPSKVERKSNEKLSKTNRETIEKTMTRYFALFGIRSGFVRDALAVRRARKNSVDRKNGVGCSLQGL